MFASAALLAVLTLPQNLVATPQDSALQPGIDAGPGTFVAFQPDDSIPLPEPSVIVPGPTGDRSVAPPAGDPFFLGFAAGPYFAPEGEHVDPLFASRLQSAYADGRPRFESYAFAMCSKRITPERVAVLEDLGCRVLEFHPHYALKLALPPTAVDAVAALDFVRWIGSPRDWQKVHPLLARELEDASAGAMLDVYVDVFDSDLNADSTSTPRAALGAGTASGEEPVPGATTLPSRWRSNGWQQRALEGLGLEVLEYVDDTRSFLARMPAAALESLTAQDFVQFVEPYVAAESLHDESMPMVQLDFGRTQANGGTNQTAIAGIADTGYDINHSALGNLSYVWWDYTGQNNALQDNDGHGTHVAGTLRGQGSVRASYTGAAPGLGWGATGRFFIARIFSGNPPVFAAGLTTATIMNDFGQPYFDGTNTSPRPHVINNSWGAAPGTDLMGNYIPYVGSEAEARAIDNAVYDKDQLHVFAAGNSGPGVGSVTVQGCAKNAFTVGNVVDYFEPLVGDPGNLWRSSSRGPCADTRWKPNIVAPGRWIFSADVGTGTGYINFSGTSMAAPHVTGLAAQLCDHYAWLQYAPARLMSLLMATAMTKDNAVLATPADAHLGAYGAGRIEAYKAHGVTPHWSWGNFAFTQGWAGYTFGDFNVPAGATRLVVCMTYNESASSAGAAQALVNDLDLWIDDPSNGISAGGNSGDYFAQQSNRNNTEIRIIENPPAGAWRWKAYPTSFGLLASVKASVTYCYVTGSTTPDGELLLSATNTCVQPNASVDISATVTNPSYVASAVFLDSTVTDDPLLTCTTTLKDGAPTLFPNIPPSLYVNTQHNGYDVLLGDITAGDTRRATWTARWATEGIKQWQVQARSDNWVPETQTINITVDGTGPGSVGNLTSTTHAPNVWSNNANIAYAWQPATDNVSGLFGYGILTRAVPTMPPQAINIANPGATTYAETLLSSTWYFNIRALDNCGNWSPIYATTGPYLIDVVQPVGPTNVSSSTHTPSVQSCDELVTVEWTAATDAHSGLAGYIALWDTSPTTDPTTPPNLGPLATSFSINIGASTQARWLHLRAVDVAGNRGTTVHFGPIYANGNSVAPYCTGKTNSLGCVPQMAWVNQPSIGGDDFEVRCTGVLNNKNGLLYWGYAPSSAPFQGGLKCVAAPTQRTSVQPSGGTPSGNNCSGTYSFTFDSSYMAHQGIDVGDTLYAQWWMRDPAAASTTGLSNGLKFTVCE